MGLAKIVRIFSVALVMALTIAALPAAPALAAAEITLSPGSGKVGDTITVSGTGFSTSTNEKHSLIYFSADNATVANYIDNQVTRYKLVADVVVEDDGTFSRTFTVPSVLSDGDSNVNVQGGTTYYIYATSEYFNLPYPTYIKARTTFTIVGGSITLSPTRGVAGTSVSITGSDFSASKAITAKFDGIAISLTGGNTSTSSSGTFTSNIAIPESAGGAHTVTVTISGNDASATFTVDPELSIEPTSGNANTPAIVRGKGFGTQKTVTIYFNGMSIATATTTLSGSFLTTITIPDGFGAGLFNVDAEDAANNLAKTKFTVTVPAPSTTPPPAPAPTPTPTPTPSPSTATLSINSSTGYVGSNLLITGIGFAAGKTVTIKYEGEAVATANADINGLFVAAFKIPASKGGDHTITASDGTNTKELTFTVETVAPKIPQPTQPAMGDKVKSPITFKWGQVTDDSTPVTYELQIASDKDFDEKSLELEKELTQTEYTLTAEEEKDLAGKETPYYWRIRAVDAAENASQWTGAGEFYITPPFSIPDWALYTIIGLAGIFLFAIGYLLGRRTAFYY